MRAGPLGGEVSAALKARRGAGSATQPRWEQPPATRRRLSARTPPRPAGRQPSATNAGPRAKPTNLTVAATYTDAVDLDAYVLAHAYEWQRLEQLVHKGRLSGSESDELVDLYQQVATHLSVVRTSAPDPSLVAHLSSLLTKARNKAVGTRVSTWRGFTGFFTARFPAALYRLRYWWLGCLAANVA